MKLSRYASVALSFLCVIATVAIVYFGVRLLLGKEYTLTAVVIENHEDARPNHAGLNDALLIEEWLVEGFISRLVAVFDADNLPSKVGPVRSLRPYFLEALFPWEMAIFHAGGSPQALEIVGSTYKLTSINGIGSYNDKYERDEDLSPPHDLFIRKKNMKSILKELKPKEKAAWPPYKEGPAKSAPSADIIDLNFFSPVHNITYKYEYSSERYIRRNGEEKSKAQPRNVVVLEMPINNIVEYGRLDISVNSRGNALLFRSGNVYEGRWTKNGRGNTFEFIDDEGKPLVFAYGQTWITVLPTLDRVTWKGKEEEEKYLFSFS